jgi:hypothetical protein
MIKTYKQAAKDVRGVTKAPRTTTTLGGTSLFGYIPGAPVEIPLDHRTGGSWSAGNNPVKYTDPDGNETKPLILKQVESVIKMGIFLYNNREAIQKIGIGTAKAAMGVGLATLGVGGGAAITVGSSGAAVVGGVAVADAAIVAGAAITTVGAKDIVDGIVMMMQGNGNGSGSSDTEPASEKTAISMRKQIERDLGQNAGRDFHEMKEGPDRTLLQLKEDAASVYKDYGKSELLPKWMAPE